MMGLRILLTGGIGSGKTTVADLFAGYGVPVIDTDNIAHQLTGAQGGAMPSVRKRFGNAFIRADGAMDRLKMRQHILTHPAEKRFLEAILHPKILDESLRAIATIENSQATYLVVVIPLLAENSHWRLQLDAPGQTRILVVDCPETTQRERVLTRDATMTPSILTNIMATQASRQDRLTIADDVIVNDTTLSALEQQVAQQHALYSSFFKR